MILPKIEDSTRGPQAVDASAKLLDELLGELESKLLTLGVPVSEWLNPGLDPTTITDKLAEHGLGAPEELLTLYGWHNGIASNLGAGAIPRFPFNPLETALSNQDIRVQVLERLAAESGRDLLDFDWGSPPGFLSCISDQYTIAIDCQGDPIESPQIHFTFPEFWYTPDIGRAVSLCTLVTWWIEGIESGAHERDASAKNWILHQELLPPLQRAKMLV